MNDKIAQKMNLREYVEKLSGYHKARKQFEQMYNGIQTFVIRVENGSIRSKKTYTEFKNILEGFKYDR